MTLERPDWLTMTVADVRSSSPFQDNQIRGAGGADALLARIDTAIDDWWPIVFRRLQAAARPQKWPFPDATLLIAYPATTHTPQERETISKAQQKSANLAVKLLTLAEIHNQVPGEDNQAMSKARQDGRGEAIIGGARLGSAEAVLVTLETEVREIAALVLTMLRRQGRMGTVSYGRGVDLPPLDPLFFD